MLQNVEKRYVEEVVSIMKTIVNGPLKLLIEAYVTDGIPDGIEVDFLPELTVMASVQTHAGKTAAKTASDEFIFTRFEVNGAMVHFLAFCLQESELLYRSECQKCKKRGHCPNKSPDIHLGSEFISNRIEVSEWREYIKDKYHVLPPVFDYDEKNSALSKEFAKEHPDEPITCKDFADFLYRYGFQATGGIACPECLMQ